jgi:hypothetical protein
MKSKVVKWLGRVERVEYFTNAFRTEFETSEGREHLDDVIVGGKSTLIQNKKDLIVWAAVSTVMNLLFR